MSAIPAFPPSASTVKTVHGVDFVVVVHGVAPPSCSLYAAVIIKQLQCYFRILEVGGVLSMTYDRDKAISYAQQWAYSRNPSYYNFDTVGGDCTNFISQCLHAGGCVMNYTRDTGWYYKSPRDRAAAWSGVDYLYRFLTANHGKGPYASELPLEYTQPGDIIQLSFDGIVFGHSLIVVSTYPAFLVATHTVDCFGRPLDTYQYRHCRLLHIDGTRL